MLLHILKTVDYEKIFKNVFLNAWRTFLKIARSKQQLNLIILYYLLTNNSIEVFQAQKYICMCKKGIYTNISIQCYIFNNSRLFKQKFVRILVYAYSLMRL